MSKRYPGPPVRSSDVALVIGAAKCVWDDVGVFQNLVGPHAHDVIAVNIMGVFWPYRLHHWASLHPLHLCGWCYSRYAMGLPGEFATHSADASLSYGVDYEWPAARNYALDSGIFGLLAACWMGYGRIVAAGIPLDNSPKVYEPDGLDHGTIYTEFGANLAGSELADMLAGSVRSLSGATRDVFGMPDPDWLMEAAE